MILFAQNLKIRVTQTHTSPDRKPYVLPGRQANEMMVQRSFGQTLSIR